MERPHLKIGILTSTRADFGIYQPLLRTLRDSYPMTDFEIIAFGTHLSPHHGYTLQEVEAFGMYQVHKVYGMPLSDEPAAIAAGYGHLVAAFSQFWSTHHYDWVLCLGDRYEMSAAVQAGIPMQLRFAHLHGGETTLGAIDNIYRHQISLAASLHFVATEIFADRVREITHSDQVHAVGALSLDGIKQLRLPEWKEVGRQFKLPVDDFVLVTFHPETIAYEHNTAFSAAAKAGLAKLTARFPIIITLPNADTAGTLFRTAFRDLKKQYPERVFLVESFGRLNYFAAIRQARLLLGNTSSGIIEAASFGKYVVNVGDRQKGRPQSENVRNVAFDPKAIEQATMELAEQGDYAGSNSYYRPNTAQKIIEILRHASL